MTIENVDNRATFLGGNNKAKSVFEAAAGAERVVTAGTFLVQKAGDGTKYVLHSDNLDLKIAGLVAVDLNVAASGSAADITISRAYDGFVDEKKLVEVNAIASLDVIPGTQADSYRTQLEDISVKPLFRENI